MHILWYPYCSSFLSTFLWFLYTVSSYKHQNMSWDLESYSDPQLLVNWVNTQTFGLDQTHLSMIRLFWDVYFIWICWNLPCWSLFLRKNVPVFCFVSGGGGGGGVEAQEDVYRQCSFSAATLGSEQDWPVVGKHMPCGKGILVFYDNAHYMIIWSDKWSNGTIGQDWKEVQVVEFRNSGIEIKQL